MRDIRDAFLFTRVSNFVPLVSHHQSGAQALSYSCLQHRIWGEPRIPYNQTNALNSRKQSTVCRITALSLLLLFLSGWLMAPVKLALPEPVTCGMECCLTQGYCSCKLHHAASSGHEGHNHSEDKVSGDDQMTQAVEIDTLAISAPCPSPCVLPPSGLQSFSIPKAGLPEHSIVFNAARLIYVRAPHFARDALVEESHAPRAPPAALL